MKDNHRTERPRTRLRQAGFNLAEVAIGLSLFMTVGALGGPPLANYIHRAKLEGGAYEMSALLRASRAIAITRGTPAIVRVDTTTGDLVAFADLHGETESQDPDGIFNPIAGRPQRLTDYEIGRVPLPSGAVFGDPDGDLGLGSIEGFENPTGLPSKVVIFVEDGSVRAPGAFRVADGRGNYLEIVAAPRAATRIEVRKWDGSYWLSRGQGVGAWEWQ